jgi:tetratricopeptide (TPR) repeat protein
MHLTAKPRLPGGRIKLGRIGQKEYNQMFQTMGKFGVYRFWVATAILFSAAVCTSAQDFLPELVRRIKPSSVAIETFDARNNTVARGSGFFIAHDRVITNRHVIERSTRAEIQLVDGKRFPVRGVLAIDGEGDLALLQVDVPRNLAIPLTIMRTSPQEGESIVVIGNPFGLEGSVSNGIVSAVREISGYGKIIQITASISPGSSGSPVVNMAGQVVGVATLQAAEGQNLNFAVPAERIMQMKVSDAQTFAAINSESQRNKRSSAERLYSQGLAQLSRDDYARAAALFEKAVEVDPNYAEAWYQAGYSYGVMGRHNDSLRTTRQAARLRPDWAAAFVNIGASSFALGQFKEANEAYRQALKLDENNAETLYALGLTLGRLSRTEEEILFYKRAVALKPDHANAYEKLGLALFKQKRYSEAVSAFEQLRTYKPDARTYNYLGESLFESGKADESVEAFNNALGYNPDMDRARFNLGRAYLKNGDREMAAVQYEILKNSRSEYADRLLVLLNP